ncbi:MAG: TIGR02453 family protein, partial [Candidatus Dadabacteria bacterium]
LKRKDFFALQRVEPGLALRPEFVDEVTRAFVALKPLMKFLTDALGLAFSLAD